MTDKTPLPDTEPPIIYNLRDPDEVLAVLIQEMNEPKEKIFERHSKLAKLYEQTKANPDCRITALDYRTAVIMLYEHERLRKIDPAEKVMCELTEKTKSSRGELFEAYPALQKAYDVTKFKQEQPEQLAEVANLILKRELLHDAHVQLHFGIPSKLQAVKNRNLKENLKEMSLLLEKFR